MKTRAFWIDSRGRCFLTLGAILLLGSCRPTPPPELPAEPVAGFPVTQATPDCAPWDGPAVSILFSGESTHPDSIRPPYLRVALWQSLDRVAGPTWRWPADAQTGAASLCLAEKDCRAATAGVVWLEPIGVDSAIAGRLRLDFADRSTIAGSFRAVWRPRVGRCG